MTPKAFIFASDEMYRFGLDGKIRTQYDSVNEEIFLKQELSQMTEEDIKERIIALCNDRIECVDDCVNEIVTVAENHIAPAARMMFVIKKIFVPKIHPDLAWSLWISPSLDAFIATLQKKSAEQKSIAQKTEDFDRAILLLTNVLNGNTNFDSTSSEALDKAVLEETKRELSQYLHSDIELHGDAKHPITNNDKQQIQNMLKQSLKTAKEDAGKTASQLKSEAQSGRANPTIQRITEELSTLAATYDDGLGLILKSALNNEYLGIELVPGTTVTKSFPAYRQTAAYGVYLPRKMLVRIPCEHMKSKEIDVEEELGRKVEGLFAPMMEKKQCMLVSDEDLGQKRQQVWAEELAHAGIATSFEQENAAPFLTQKEKERFKTALISDIRSNPKILAVMQDQQPEDSTVGQIIKSGDFADNELFELLAHELPVKLAFTYNKKNNMDGFREQAPEIAKYFEEVVIPKAQARLSQSWQSQINTSRSEGLNR